MIPISKQEIAKWRIEIENAERFRDDNFGERKHNTYSKAGENIGYFESGISEKLANDLGLKEPLSVINVVYPIVKNIIPTLYYRNPYILALPKRKLEEDAVSAPYAAGILNYFHKELDIKEVNKQVIFDAFILGMGVCKLGYTTKFGTIPNEQDVEKEKKEREKAKEKSLLEKLGLKKPKKEEEQEKIVDLNEYIRAESPFVKWVNPFEFGIDPSATNINNARFVYEKVTKLLSDVKKQYRNAKDLKGVESKEGLPKDIPATVIDDFKWVDLYEILYKTDDGINILVLAKDQQEYTALKHEKSVYDMDGFQYEVLYFNKHNHSLYPVSDLEIIKGLQDRINQTLENILDQVDKYVPKIFVDETSLTEQGKRALRDGDIGSIVYTNKSPTDVVREGSFTQLKADLVALIDKLLEVIMLETGLTKAQLMGMTSAQTATEAQIGQAGQNLRLSDKTDQVSEFASRQARKLWQIIRQFVDLEDISLITGEEGIDQQTGQPIYSWMPDIDSEMAKKLIKGEYRFDIEVGSTEKPDLPILRKQIENMATILGAPGTLQAIRAQGWDIELIELFKEYLGLFPNMFKNQSRIIKRIAPPQPMLPQQPGQPMLPQQPGQPMNRTNMLRQPPPNMADIVSAAAGEKGNGAPLA